MMSGHVGGGVEPRLAAMARSWLAGTAIWLALGVPGALLAGGGGALAQSVRLANPAGAGVEQGLHSLPGTRTSGVRAGNGTGDMVHAFDPAAAGMRKAGQGASLLAALGGTPAPFDMNGVRSQPPMVEPAPSEAAPAAPTTPAATSPATTPAPAIGAGAPAPGAATPGAAQPAEATPAAAANATATDPGASTPVAARIGELIADQLPRFTARTNEQEALAAFYAARQFQPVFTAGTTWSPLGTAVQQQIAASWKDGLQPADYEVPALAAHPGDTELATAELRLAATLMLYARHVQSGRFDPKRLSANVDPSPTVPDPNAVLAGVSGASDPRAVLASFAPQYDEYRLLKAQLASMDGQRHGVAPPAHVPAGPTLRPGDEDPRVPALRARLGVPGAPDDTVYSPDLVEAVRAFQKSVGERPDGAIGPMTLGALNGASEDRTADIVANMERWRWLPHEVAPTYVIVNIPEYMVRIVVNEQAIHETRVIVGKPENQTPLMTENMQYTVFNPSWNVPPGIMRNEMLPKLRSDPYALSRQGIDVVRNGRVVDPGSVDWSRGTQGYSFRQPPGERNALGNMKFMFPNKHSVYLHDTPNRTLFARDQRALSHGCVRVHEPMKFAEVLFSLGLPGEGWNEQRIGKLIGGKEKYLNLKQRFPVHLAYFTTYVDGDGRLVTRPDLYGTNAATKAMLGIGGASQMADGGTPTKKR
ncbi:L,D-transpeptidase family protein [Ancylobacter sp. Lp-2]|uniref:L,D-transpeptidase family protein n=1 Tax=Ancylobacter sp. Lp-2 TaxID=2881339 RepID=UPI001E3E1BC7|nr:L,D-transpeptidase family protein [Ancylobacter sp. Lp-2]MCB4770889.1 L,D-transpeptidase family protein [Ancylobacter sp. Lp-2]